MWKANLIDHKILIENEEECYIFEIEKIERVHIYLTEVIIRIGSSRYSFECNKKDNAIKLNEDVKAVIKDCYNVSNKITI